MTDSPRLVMTEGPQPGQAFILEQNVITVGRAPTCTIVVTDPQVSRQHARIRRQGGLWVIEDLGSTNGTFVNGVRLTSPHVLVNGNVIGLGDTVCLTYYGVEAESLPEVTMGTRPPFSAEAEPVAMPPFPAYEPPFPPPLAYAPVPPPTYAAPAPLEPPMEEPKHRTGLWIGLGCLGITLVCIGVGVFLWFAPASFWQVLIDLGIPVPTWPF